MKGEMNLKRIVIVAAAVVLAIVCALLVMRTWIPALQAEKVEQDVRKLYYGSVSFLDNLFPSALAEEEIELPPVQEDFLELYKQNSDVVGWLKAGDIIDHPVVQSDNEYYLTHDFYRRSDSNGTLFVNMDNTLIPRDDVILIHGHNMRSGAMFGRMYRYGDFEYLCKYPVITFRTIYDEDDVYYTPIAVFNASMKQGNTAYYDITQYNFEDDPEEELTPAATEIPETEAEQLPVRKSAAYQKYLDEICKLSMWKPETDVTVDDKLLMLVTCSYVNTDGRLMLVCRALREDETPEMIEALYAPYLEETPS